jgi:hypothetical protein
MTRAELTQTSANLACAALSSAHIHLANLYSELLLEKDDRLKWLITNEIDNTRHYIKSLEPTANDKRTNAYKRKGR